MKNSGNNGPTTKIFLIDYIMSFILLQLDLHNSLLKTNKIDRDVTFNAKKKESQSKTL